MEIYQKLEILAGSAKYDVSCASSGSGREAPLGGFGNAKKAVFAIRGAAMGAVYRY